MLFFPRDPNPYQELLREALTRRGFHVEYVRWSTRSHTANLLLLPVQLLHARLRGRRLLHVHWVYPFHFPGLSPRIAKRLAWLWFTFILTVVRMLGLRLVWTAHNVLPHTQVFPDDVLARRRLVAAADVVLAHSVVSMQQLRELGAEPRRAVITPHGPFGGSYTSLPDRRSSRVRLGLPPDIPLVVFFGKVAPYKGVLGLVSVWPEVESAIDDARLLIVGACADAHLAAELQVRSSRCSSVTLRLEAVDEATVPFLLRAADLVCLPFETVTTSGSALLAIGVQRGLLIPDLPALQDLPGDVLRYEPGQAGLRAGLVQALRLGRQELDRKGREAQTAIGGRTWDAAADKHVAAYAAAIPRLRSDTE